MPLDIKADFTGYLLRSYLTSHDQLPKQFYLITSGRMFWKQHNDVSRGSGEKVNPSAVRPGLSKACHTTLKVRSVSNYPSAVTF